uniref:G_PROTEIN_RECEP_F1_2 domain-containing protein n=1 Tax=Caenorhabditis tropicalis TaxID=1561998 RepID=A0A1I7TY80_9PELO
MKTTVQTPSTTSKSTTINPYLNNDHDYIYSDLFDSQFGHKYNSDFLTDDFEKNMSYYYDIVLVFKQIYDVAVFVNVFVNLPHLYFLTRKELRTNLVYIIMIGICVSDLIHSAGRIAQLSMTWHIFYKKPLCMSVFPYFHVITDIIAKCMQIMSRRCAGFLALFIAAFRAFSVTFPMSNAVNFLMKPESGLLIVIVVMAVCTGWSSMYYFSTIIEKITE